MRFSRLDILRYGALTDRSLVFRQDARLHIVLGANEAGKSSALAAISDLLFGFPSAARFHFLHDAPSLRVGAELVARNGERIAFRRRRGQKNTLLSADDAEQPLAEDALAAYLGNLSRDVFERAFGLGSASLRAGGRAMLKSGGEIGSLLFSAASGLTGLGDLRRQLETEADGIYAPRRAKDRLFYQAVDDYDEARRQERESELKSADWRRIVAERQQIDADIAAVEQERRGVRRSLESLHRQLRLEPLLREIDREQGLLDAFADLAAQPQQMEILLAEALEAARANADDMRVTAGDIDNLERELLPLQPDAALLEAVPAITAIFAEKGAFAKASEDIQRVRAEYADFDQRLLQLARRLGFEDAGKLAATQPSDAHLALVRQLVEEGARLEREAVQLQLAGEERRQTLAALEDHGGAARLLDPKPWQERLAALRPDIAAIAESENLETALARAEASLAAAALRLDPQVSDVQALLLKPLPSLELLAEHNRRAQAGDNAQTRAQEKLRGLQAEALALAKEITALAGAGTLVTAGTLEQARRQRDALFDAFAGSPQTEGETPVRAAIAKADRFADAMLADAERVSRHAGLCLRQTQLQEEIAAAQLALDDASAAVMRARQDFAALFSGVDVLPAAPERMLEWRRAVDELFRLSAMRDDATDALARLRLKQQRLVPELVAIADALGFSPAALPPAALSRALEARLSEQGERWNERRSSEGLRRAAEEALAKIAGREAALAAEKAQWRDRFGAAMAALGLPQQAGREMALAALEVWRQVPDLLAERDNRRRRVDGMARDIEAFRAELRRLCEQLAPDLAELPADVAATLLNDRAAEAGRLKSRAEVLAGSLARAHVAQERLAGEAVAYQARLAGLASSLNRPSERLDAALQELRERNAILERLARCRQRLAEQGEGAGEAELRHELEGFDRIGAGLEIERLEAEDNRLVEAFSALRAAAGDNLRRRQQLEAGSGAEAAVFRKNAAAARAHELARRWLVLKLAASILSHSMEEWRERQSDPVIRRAGRLFADLTNGRFTQLVESWGDGDEPELFAERENGDRLALDALSEGTGDQLYLALRLAFLEDYCRRNEPAPLILDDVFQTFDDSRTAAGIRVLAAGGDHFQSIIFTHQASLVEIARREIGAGLDVVTLQPA